MKVVFNKLIPFKGFLAITLWPFIFVRSELKAKFGDVDENHEDIHGCQQVEVMATVAAIVLVAFLFGASVWWFTSVPVSFYTLYILEWLIRLVVHGNQKEAYRNISFEQEAYLHESDFDYIPYRKHFAWIKYLTQKTYVKGTFSNRTELNMDNF